MADGQSEEDRKRCASASPAECSQKSSRPRQSHNLVDCLESMSVDADGKDNETFIPKWAELLFRKMDQTFNAITSLQERFSALEMAVFDARRKADEAKVLAEEAAEISRGSKDLAKETRDHMVDIEQSVDDVKRQLQALEDQRRKLNLIVAGVEDGVDETKELLQGKLNSIFVNYLHLTDLAYVHCHRLGSYSQGRSRGVLVTFHNMEQRSKVWRARFSLKGSELFIREDFSITTRQARDKLYPFRQAAIASGKKAMMRGDSVIIDGQRYKAEDEDTLRSLFPLRIRQQPSSNRGTSSATPQKPHTQSSLPAARQQPPSQQQSASPRTLSAHQSQFLFGTQQHSPLQGLLSVAQQQSTPQPTSTVNVSAQNRPMRPMHPQPSPRRVTTPCKHDQASTERKLRCKDGQPVATRQSPTSQPRNTLTKMPSTSLPTDHILQQDTPATDTPSHVSLHNS